MTDKASDTYISKFLSLVLRHNPGAAGLAIDENGWTSFEKLFAAVKDRFNIDRTDLLRVINENPKKRFTLEGDRIRAAQAHSLDIELGLIPSAPNSTLFHGTTETAWQSIQIQGLNKMDRTHVHLSSDTNSASIVAKRRKGPHIILEIDAVAMAAAGNKFYLADNAVWLCEHVPPKYINIVSEPHS